MKKIKILIAVVALFSLNSNVFAQWQTNGNDIYYNNGKVGIGTSTPGILLDMYTNNSGTDGDGLRIFNDCSTNRNTLTLNNDIVTPDAIFIQMGIHGSNHTGSWLGYNRANSAYLRAVQTNFLLFTTISKPIVFGINSSKVAEFRTDNNFEISNNGKGIILTAPNGSKWLVTVDNNGNLTTTGTTKILEVENRDNINVFPNPTKNNIKIELNTNEFQEINVELYDISGKMIYMKSYKSNSINLNISDFEAGTYILKVKNNEGQIIKTEKIVKK